MASRRPPRSAGTTGLWDRLRRPPRYPVFPPGPEESPADVRAIKAGEGRRLVCRVRAASGPWPRRYQQGTLELRGHTASWRRVPGVLSSRLVIDVQNTSVLGARPAGHREQRFGSPASIHLFALVRCATPAGPLELVAPAADVPLITRFFGGQPDVHEAALLAAAVPPGPRREPASEKRGWALAAAACGLLLGAVAVIIGLPGLSGWWMRIPFSLAAMLLANGIVNFVRARQRKRRDGTADPA